MTIDISRRTVLCGLASGTMELLLQRRFAYAELLGTPVSNEVRTGKAGVELSITAASKSTLRLSITAIDEILDDTYSDGSLITRSWSPPLLQVRIPKEPQSLAWGGNKITVSTEPLRLTVEQSDRGVVQELTFDPGTNRVSFLYGNAPVYGLGGGLHPLDRRGTKDAMRNGSGENLSIYGARTPIPWLVGANGWGLFFHEPGGTFDLTRDIGVFHPSDVARGQDIFLVLGDSPAHLMREWAELTGYPHLPPKWALGYQQSHRTLASRAEVLDEAKTFREKKLPCDALIYLGTGFCPSGWNTGHGSFTFNEDVFPDPEAMIQELHRENFNVVLHVVNPPENLHGKVTDTGTAKEPGDAAAYWDQHVPFVHMGVDGWWPDEGDVLPTASRLVRNEMYWEGGRLTRPDRRPYALHRNGYAGLQRYGWLWSGDVFSTWKTLAAQVMVGINMGLTGIPYWGTDTGGFVPTKELTAELFIRWFQFSAFCPLFRSHGRTWKLRLPWGWNTGSYGPAEMGTDAISFLPKPEDLHNPEVERICRKYLNTRYQLLPYLYSAVAETHETGIPLMRSLWFHYPDDKTARTTEDVYMFGGSLLIAPVVEPGATEKKVYLPAGIWWNFWTSQRLEGGQVITAPLNLETMPVYVRAGSIIPTGPIKQFAMEASAEPVKLTVYPSADGHFSLYDDDGLTFAHEKGDFTRVEIEWTDSTRTLVLKPGKGKISQQRSFHIAVVGGSEKKIAFHNEMQVLHL